MHPQRRLSPMALAVVLVAIARVTGCSSDPAQSAPIGTAGLASIGGSASSMGGVVGGNFGIAGAAVAVPVTRSPAPLDKAISTRFCHTCAVAEDGTTWCWGGSNNANIEYDLIAPSAVPVRITDINQAVAVAVGFTSACVRRRDGSVWCWGSSGLGVLGSAMTQPESPPIAVSGLGVVVDLAVGERHACALNEAGNVTCWGSNDWGQMSSDDLGFFTDGPVGIESLADVAAVSSGHMHLCALKRTGSVYCWGYNASAQTGLPVSDRVTIPALIGGLPAAIGIEAGGQSNCAVAVDGTLRCWGANIQSVGDALYYYPPVEARLRAPVVHLSGSGTHYCAVLDDGSVWCWGRNASGQLGTGDLIESEMPRMVPGINDARLATTGLFHTCVVLSDGVTKCWGGNQYGQLGNGAQGQDSLVPVVVAGLPKVVVPD